MEKLNKGYLYKTDYKVDFSKIPLSEYPRPSLKRDSYLCLNGKWEYSISKDEKLPSSYQGFINVPYAVESCLSGVNHLLEPDEYIFYRRKVDLDESFKGKNIIIHFEGVDQICEVFIDGKLVIKHTGAYVPFQVKLNYSPSFGIVLRVRDLTDTSYHARGKQSMIPTGWFYSSSSGVYKPIWIEGVDDNYIQDIKYYPDVDKKTLKIKITTPYKETCHVEIEGKDHLIFSNSEESITFDSVHLWSIDDPFLYDVKITCGTDQVTSYFGFRKVEIKEDETGIKRIYLNGEKIFISGLLDQGYYYLGNLTPADYKDYLGDIFKAKDLGFNCLRVHIKIECEMFYYYADKCGILLIQDFPSGGEKYQFVPTVIPRLLSYLDEKNITYEKLSRSNEEGRKEFISEALFYLEYLNNHPSIIIYTIFNEGWGEFDPSKIYHMLKAKYPFTLFDTASGWYDADSDFYSIHTYTFPGMKRKDKKGRAFIISEMGGIGLRIASNSILEDFYGHGKCYSEVKFQKKLIDLYIKKIIPQIKKRGLNMAIYTQLNDCETEDNGLYTFDRLILKLPKEVIEDINQKLKDSLS